MDELVKEYYKRIGYEIHLCSECESKWECNSLEDINSGYCKIFKGDPPKQSSIDYLKETIDDIEALKKYNETVYILFKKYWTGYSDVLHIYKDENKANEKCRELDNSDKYHKYFVYGKTVIF